MFIAVYRPLKELIGLASSYNELYSHIILIPIVSGYLIYLKREEIFSKVQYSISSGTILIILSIIIYSIGLYQGIKINKNDYLSIMAFSALIFWVGCFILLYGYQAFKAGTFPFLFLVLMIPLPTLVADNIIYLLQSASAEVSYTFIKSVGVPIFREGFVFQLPGLSVEVAEQCSGIRSTIALIITSILAGHLFLKSASGKVILVLSIFPITIIKNGLRITTLSILGAYVDISFITDSLLHKKGGVLFFILGLVLLTPILWLLKRSEERYHADKLKI